MSKMPKQEYARRRGVHPRTICRYIAEGFIPDKAISKRGRKIIIDARLADQALDNSITTRKELLGGKVSPSNPAKVTPKRKLQISEKAGTVGLSFHEARTLTQRYKAALLKIELDEKTGRLVDAEQVETAAFNKARTVRDSIMNLPDRIAPILAAESDPVRIVLITQEELKSALEELSR